MSVQERDRHASILKLYNLQCKDDISLPQPGHVCSDKCRLVELIRGKERFGYPIFICKASRNIHSCGEKCNMSVLSHDGSGYVCRLTGFMLPGKIFKHALTIGKDNSYSKRHYTNDNYVTMPEKRVRPKRQNSMVNDRNKLVRTILHTMQNILMGQKRVQLHEKAKKKYFNDIVDSFKNIKKQKGRVCITDAISCASKLRLKCKRSLNRPLETKNSTFLQKYALSIADYFVKMKKNHFNISDTVNSAEIFTACMLEKLATGFRIKGFTLVPKVHIFERHVPDEVQFGGIQKLRCRAMSIMNRNMQSAYTTKNGHPRIDLKFEQPC